MGDILTGGGDELEGETFRIVGIVFADPGQPFFGNLELPFVEVDDVALERRLAEDAVHKPAGFLLVEVQRGVAIFPIESKVVLPQRLAGGVHQQRRFVVKLDIVFDFVLFAQLDPDAGLLLLHFEAGFVDGGNQAETYSERCVLRRALVDLLDAFIPGSDLTLLLPVRHFLLHVTEIGDHAHELRVRELLLVKGVSDVVPEFQDVARWHRP